MDCRNHRLYGRVNGAFYRHAIVPHLRAEHILKAFTPDRRVGLVLFWV